MSRKGKYGAYTRNAGEEELFAAIVEQAVEDLRKLEQIGYVRKTSAGVAVKSFDRWPRVVGGRERQCKKMLNYYDRPSMLKDLVTFFTDGHAVTICKKLGADHVKQDDLLKAVGLL